MTPDIEESIRCTVSSCSCVCFKPGNTQLRSCDRCGHGWVAHALEKLQAQPPSSCGPVEVALPGLVFDLSTLILYGAQAIPVRLKILLDRLYSVLTPEQVSHILHTLGWSLGDYVRGYMLQYPNGKVLDRWLMVTQEEELLILKQFLRFGETRPIVELMTLQCFTTINHFADSELNPVPKSCQSSIGTFIEHKGRTPGIFKNTKADSCLVAGICHFEKNSPADHDTVQHSENFPTRLSLLLPFNFPNSAVHCLVPSTKELVPPSKSTQYLRKPSGTKLTERHRQDGGKRGREKDPILPRSKGELALKIKVDPDNPNTAQSLWHQNHQFHYEPDVYRGKTKPENVPPLSPTLNSSLNPPSSLYPPISSSTSSFLKTPQSLQDSSSPSLHSLPSFSSSFFCSPPTSPFSSSLHPLPSSLCSLPSSPAGGRKGRVCCGVCGKSFYDKGTLKIHYNAVHLKIKHRCTVAGCTMVFSSLRSRNRHSANPNPRLHTSSNRDTQIHKNSETHIHEAKQARKNIHNTDTRLYREKKVCDTRWQQDDEAHMLKNRYNTPSQDNSPALSHPPPQTLSQETHQNFPRNNSTYRSNLDSQATPPPPHLTAHCASSVASPPKPKHYRHQVNHTTPAFLSDSIPITLANCTNQSVSCEYGTTEGKQRDVCTSPVTNQQQQWESGDPMPKKKPRKSSMPVKIEREKLERGRSKEEQEES